MKPVFMPRLSESMDQGKIIAWLKKEGDRIAASEIIAEIETDKATLELESPDEGILLRIVVREGRTAAPGEIIAYIGADGERADAPAMPAPTPPPVKAAPDRPAPAKGKAKPEKEPPRAPDPKRESPSRPKQEPPAGDSGGPRRAKATPLARKVAESHGINLDDVRGSGPGGRILLGDVEGLLEKRGGISLAPGGVEPGAAERNGWKPSKDVADKGVPLSRMRQAIAKSMAMSKPGMPHFYTRVAVDVGALGMLKKSLDGRYQPQRISWTALFLRAAAEALRRMPKINSVYHEAGGKPSITIYEKINIGVAVAVDDGIVLPVMEDLAGKSIMEISERLTDLAKRTREGQLKATELQGATFSVSNLGMTGIEEFAAVIPPGQSCMLALGAVAEEPVVVDGRIEIRSRVRMTLSADHRVVDGWAAAEFLMELKKVTENPLELVL